MELPANHLSYYILLGVDRDSSIEDIKEAYHRKLLETHPDKQNVLSNVGAQIQLLKQAYKTLTESRSEYDKALDLKLTKMGLGPDLASGLEAFDLDDFNEEERDGQMVWIRDCPRCTTARSFEITEDDLVQNAEATGGTSDGSYALVIQCSSCSLWLKVKYYEEAEMSD